jgi:hypothetical protein
MTYIISLFPGTIGPHLNEFSCPNIILAAKTQLAISWSFKHLLSRQFAFSVV